MSDGERRTAKVLTKQPEIEIEEEEGERIENSQNYGIQAGNGRLMEKAADEQLVISADNSPNSDGTGSTVTGLGSDEGGETTEVEDRLSGDTVKEFQGNQPTEINHIHAGPHVKKALTRGKAVCEGASPPPHPEVKVITTPAPDDNDISSITVYPPSLGSNQSFPSSRNKLQKNGSQSSDAGTSSSMSRESSVEKYAYKDSTGVDLLEFIKRTLNKSTKDKKMLLQLERDFRRFVNDPKDQFLQLSEMCSYDRMLVHRMAAFYGLDHNINQSGKCVIVSKTKHTRVPDFCCDEYVKATSDGEQTRKILQKPRSLDEKLSRGDKEKLASQRAKSLEERQKIYDETRKQIFGNTENGCPYSIVLDVDKAVLSNQWSSTDSSGYGTEDGRRVPRSLFPKSNSFGGKPTVHLAPINNRTHSLSKADSIQHGTYESAPVRPNKLPTQSPDNSDQSPLSRSSSAEVSHSPSLGHFTAGNTGPPYPVLVANDVSAIPLGSMVVNPHTR